MPGNSRVLPPHGFPWGSNNPARRERIVVAAIIATFAAFLTATEYWRRAGHHSDFGQLWFGARSLLQGLDPWTLVGPGLAFEWSWQLFYPAPALVLAAPLSWMSEAGAATAFIWLSTFLLVWGATRDSWHRLPAFASLPFFVASSAAQWSALMAATWFVPAAAAVWIAKPTLGIALAVSARSRRPLLFAAIGGAALLAVSFVLQPSWVQGWRSALDSATHMRSPITQWGGFVITLCALRWRRPEARLVLALALVPHSPAVYDLLLLLVIVPDTWHEAVALSLACTLGLLIENFIPPIDPDAFVSVRGMLNVAACYLPATIIILRRRNEGPGDLGPRGASIAVQ